MPEGLYILLALISSFFLFLFFYYEQSYLSIYWTDFHDLFTKWKVFAWIFLIRSSFSDSSRDVAVATNFVSYWTCSLGAEVSQDPLDRFFSQSLHHMVGIEWQMINPTFFFRYLKGRAMATNLVAKMRQNYLPPALIALSFWYGMGYHYLNVSVNSENDASKSC